MNILSWLGFVLVGALLLLQTKIPFCVSAELTEMSISDLDAFIQANDLKINHFQATMRDVLFLWDDDSIRGDKPDIPLTLDTLRDRLKDKLQALVIVDEEDPDGARTTFDSYGFAGSPVPVNNEWNWDDTPSNRVFYPILKMLEESSSARQVFWGFFRWANSNIGLVYWFYLLGPDQTSAEWVAPKLFGGSFFKHNRLFLYDTDKRARDRRQLNIYFQLMDATLRSIKGLNARLFRMGPKFGLGVDVKIIFEHIIDIITGFRDGVGMVRDAYTAIPPLPGVDDADVEEDINETEGIAPVPATLQNRISPGYLERAKILDLVNQNSQTLQSPDEILEIPEFQFEPSNELEPLSEASAPGLLTSLPAYVGTDFDLLTAGPACSLEDFEQTVEKPKARRECNIF